MTPVQRTKVWYEESHSHAGSVPYRSLFICETKRATLCGRQVRETGLGEENTDMGANSSSPTGSQAL